MDANFKAQTPNASVTVGLLLKTLNIKIGINTIKTLEEHPAYASLLAISKNLIEQHIPNQAYKINKEDNDTTDLEFPFITHLNANGGIYIMVTHME